MSVRRSSAVHRCGWHGRYLWIDLGGLRTESIPLPDDVLRAYVGGVGLGTWLLLRHTPNGVDPLAPEAPLVISFSPLIGSPLTTSAKFAVLCKSPLTDRINDGLCSSAFALAGKRTGFDAFVVTGAAPAPSILTIDNGHVTVAGAGSLWGRTTTETERMLRASVPADAASLVIGPAGERRVRFATASHDGRHLGRGGTGAVLGAKRIKAIVVRGDRRTVPADPAALGELARSLQRASLGPATEKYRRLGTMANVELLQRLHVLPRRNFSERSASPNISADRLARPALEARYDIVRKSCVACRIACEHQLVSKSSRPGGAGVRMEYENLYALGALCGIDDPEVVRKASERCDALGMDTISTGATIALAMECAESGWWNEAAIRFGDGGAMLDLIERIAGREGPGARLAEGSRRFAESIGGAAIDRAPHIKGLELPGFEPRVMQHLALGMAVSARGADHNRSGAYEVDLGGSVDRFAIEPERVGPIASSENEAALYDSLILCKFVRRALGSASGDVMADMLRCITGHAWSADELQGVAGRIINARRWYNHCQGASATEDTLPRRFFDEPLPVGDRRVVLDRDAFESSVRAYYRWRGWSDAGVPSVRQMEDLRLEQAATAGGKGVERR